MFRNRVFTIVLASFLAFCGATAASAEAFDDVELVRVPPPEGFENSISWAVAYYQIQNGERVEVFPSRAQKVKDFDLLQAQIVHRVITEWYHAHGMGLDETAVRPLKAKAAQALVARDHVTKAWSGEAAGRLGQYLGQNGDDLALHQIHAYLDYRDDKGNWVSGLDIDPVLFHFGKGESRDQVTVIIIGISRDS